jgi:hypothetical protein
MQGLKLLKIFRDQIGECVSVRTYSLMVLKLSFYGKGKKNLNSECVQNLLEFLRHTDTHAPRHTHTLSQEFQMYVNL